MQAQSYHIKIGEGRRIVLPSEVCRSMSLGIGDTIIVRVEDNRATLSSVDRTIERFQSLLAERVPKGVSLVDELIAEREDASLRE
jgi:bifunctional DNA-binding transcriptional regulator/antitoxin component of YhaV-PrlF toxin-antitoxin module